MADEQLITDIAERLDSHVDTTAELRTLIGGYIGKHEVEKLDEPVLHALGSVALERMMWGRAMGLSSFRGARDLVQPRVVAPFLVVALPWYLLCYLRNGNVFLHDFFLVHNVERFTSNALMHVQPWWFYLPVLAGLLLPWFPLLFLLGWRAAWRDPRRCGRVVGR